MQSLTANGEGTLGAAAPLRRRRAFTGMVLPKLFRRPARMMERLDWHPPRYLGTKGVALMFAATIVSGVALGGHAADVAAAVTSWSGFAIDEVRISGQSQTDELDVLHALQIGPFPSLITFDLDAAKTRVEALPWVAQATLRKVYPNDLAVTIRERQPYALWQNGDALWLVDAEGYQISQNIDDRYTGLPLVVGDGAAAHVAEFTALLAAQPTIAAHARAGVLVGERRWTIVLDTGIELMLPETDPASALARIVALDADSQLLSREIAAVDLRDSTQVVLRLDADGAAARGDLLKARAKLAKAKT